MTVILLHRLDNPLLRLKNVFDGFRLTVAEFQHDFSIRFEERLRFPRQLSIKIKPVRAAIECGARVKIPHLRLERGNSAEGM